MNRINIIYILFGILLYVFLLNEIESENAISIIIPGILFGIGTIISGIRYNKTILLNIVTPYLII